MSLCLSVTYLSVCYLSLTLYPSVCTPTCLHCCYTSQYNYDDLCICLSVSMGRFHDTSLSLLIHPAIDSSIDLSIYVYMYDYQPLTTISLYERDGPALA